MILLSAPPDLLTMGVSIEVWRGRIGSFHGRRFRLRGFNSNVSWNLFIALLLIMNLMVIGILFIIGSLSLYVSTTHFH